MACSQLVGCIMGDRDYINEGVLFIALIGVNALVWVVALVEFSNHLWVLGPSLIAYMFGLRHAFDADHIAAIDNVTRNLAQKKRDSSTVGLFFSLGHSTVVTLATVAIILAANRFTPYLTLVQAWGGAIGTWISSLFLIGIAWVNFRICWSIYRAMTSSQLELNDPCDSPHLHNSGYLSRLLSPCFQGIRKSWHMYPIGFLFGLGFDTATEIGLLGIATAGVLKGLSAWSILIFPLLFTAGMSLVDTANSILMKKAYSWAFNHPRRKLYYNFTITAVSAAIAFGIGLIQVAGMFGSEIDSTLNDFSDEIGAAIILALLSFWAWAAFISNKFGFYKRA